MIRTETENGLVHLVIDRPEKKNALTRAMYESLSEAVERAQEVTPCALGALGASHNLCPVGCCPSRAPRPAAAGADSPCA